MKDFEILITSPFDREKLVVEISYKDQYIAEINQEKEQLQIELVVEGKIMSFDYNEFIEVLEKAKRTLLNE